MAELGADVVTVEIDREAAGHARTALRTAGHGDVVVINGNGEDGAPEHAPFDRVMATAAAHTIPCAWIEQTRAVGVIVVPWAATFHPAGPRAVLDVRADGTAEGCFTVPARFMPLYDQRLPQTVLHETYERWAEAGEPDCSHYGICVSDERQHIWLDTPDNSVEHAREP